MQRNVDRCSLPVTHTPVPLTVERDVGRLSFSSLPWQLMVTLGDAVLLATILTLFLLLAPYIFVEWRHFGSLLRLWDVRIIWLMVLLLSWSVMMRLTHAQDATIAADRFKSMVGVLFTLALVVCFCLALSFSFFLRHALSPVRVTCFFFLLAAPILVTWRLLLAEIIHLPVFQRRAVIVGVNMAGAFLLRELHQVKRPGLKVLGYINGNGETPFGHDGLPVLGNKNVLPLLIEGRLIDMIIMALDYKLNPELFQVALEAAQRGISVVPMTLVYENMSGKIPVKYIGEQWYVALPIELAVPSLYLCWSRLLDFCFGVFGSLFLALLLLPLTLMILLDSPGPIFYCQERLGQQGRPFRIYKLRTMYCDAEHVGRPVWARSADSRVTRVGRILRATHLDELPQALNVLHGDMSLIGPRPERAAFVSLLESSVPFYRCRLSVKPGLTGWAQVKYHYGSSEHDALIKLQYDLYYIKHRSLTLDIFILLRTLLEIVSCRGV